MFKRLFPASELRRDFKLADVRNLKRSAPGMLDMLIGEGEWVDDDADYGFTWSVAFKNKRGDLRAIHLAYTDRDDPSRSYILTVDQARAIIEDNL